MNPTCGVLEQRVAALEGGVGALAMASGMAAITAGVTPDMVRLSIGIEHPDDLVADLDQALTKA